tara:strand:+ start:81 stop:479 length:399 start_codon:yes stop_codon:yes gene_type:complete
MSNEYYNPDTSKITYKTFGNDDDYKDYRGRGGFLKAVTEATQRDKEDDKRMEKAKKAFNLADTFRNSSFKVSDDVTVMPGYTDPGFEYEIPGRKGFGDIIGSGAGFLIGNAIMPGVGGKYGAALGGNIGSRF